MVKSNAVCTEATGEGEKGKKKVKWKRYISRTKNCPRKCPSICICVYMNANDEVSHH